MYCLVQVRQLAESEFMKKMLSIISHSWSLFFLLKITLCFSFDIMQFYFVRTFTQKLPKLK